MPVQSDNEIGRASAIPMYLDLHRIFCMECFNAFGVFEFSAQHQFNSNCSENEPIRHISAVCVCFIIIKMSNLKESIATLNQQFESIFVHSNEIDETVKYLKSYFRRVFIRRCIQLLIVFGFLVSIYSLVSYIPMLNWNASAIGRLALIKLILPAYNWQYLYNSRCLLETSASRPITRADNQQETYVGYNDEECTICESLGNLGKTN